MIKILLARLRQGHRTMAYPKGNAPELPERFHGAPAIDAARCRADCRKCAEACPTDAICFDGKARRIDLGRCLFCDDCRRACPDHAITMTRDYRLAVGTRDDLIRCDGETHRARALDDTLRSLLGRSLKLRVVSAGGCSACEADTNVLTTIGWDIGRFGIQYVASPRHADGLLVTGPVPDNMKLALEKTYEAVPAPKIVIAVGACAISGGPYINHPEQHGGAASIVPVDLFIPGCPPHPLTILDGFLRILDRIQ